MSFYEIHGCRFPIPDRHKKDRVNFANAFLDKDVNFWRKVVFADHMRFCFDENGIAKIFIGTERDNIQNSTLAWIYFCAEGENRRMHGLAHHFTTKHYKHLLERMVYEQNQLYSFAPSPESLPFVHDWNPVNRSKTVSLWFTENPQFQILPWPRCFGDVNPIESMWSHLQDRLSTKHYEDSTNLCIDLYNEFDDMTSCDTYRNSLVDDMPQKLQKVIDCNGDSIQ